VVSVADFQTARRPFATAAPLGSCRSSTSVPTVPMSRTELDSSLLHGISAGRGTVAAPYCVEHRRWRPRGGVSGKRTSEDGRRQRPESRVGRRVLGAEATARTAIAIFFQFLLSLLSFGEIYNARLPSFLPFLALGDGRTE
jgi:hypothetical protein